MLRTLLTLLATALVGCGTHVATGTTGTGTGGSTASTATSTSGSSTQAASSSSGFPTTTSTGAGGCSGAASLVYVVSDVQDTFGNLVYTYDPVSGTFTPVTSLDCSANGQLNAMAVSRSLVGWFDFTETTGEVLYSLDLVNKGACNPVVTLPSGFGPVTMAFVPDSPGGDAETLYVTGATGSFGKIDPKTNAYIPIATLSGDPSVTGVGAWFSGTSDAKVFAYFPTTTTGHLASLDPTSAMVSADVPLMGVDPSTVGAFVRWGGDDYLFTTLLMGGDSGVAHYVPATGVLDPMLVSDVGFAAVGAAVTACAPLTHP